MSSRITIYANDTDKANVQRLLDTLDAQGVDMRGPRGDPSISKLFRYLVQQELQRISPNEQE